MKIPRTVKIGPHRFTIYQHESLSDGEVELMGNTNSNICKIRLRTKHDGQLIPESNRTETLLHEILHGANHIYEMDMTEQQISCLAPALLAVIRDNKLNFLDKE